MEFWESFLNDDLGGSDAVEVMCSKDEVVEERFIGRREVFCSTNDVFDHMVTVGSGKKETK